MSITCSELNMPWNTQQTFSCALLCFALPTEPDEQSPQNITAETYFAVVTQLWKIKAAGCLNTLYLAYAMCTWRRTTDVSACFSCAQPGSIVQFHISNTTFLAHMTHPATKYVCIITEETVKTANKRPPRKITVIKTCERTPAIKEITVSRINTSF